MFGLQYSLILTEIAVLYGVKARQLLAFSFSSGFYELTSTSSAHSNLRSPDEDAMNESGHITEEGSQQEQQQCRDEGRKLIERYIHHLTNWRT